MRPEDRKEFNGLLTELAEVYGRDLSAEALDGYFELLQDLTLPTIRAALPKAARNCKRFPTPAHIYEVAFARTTPAVGQKPKGSYPPDVAAQRLRYGLDVTLPVRPDKNAKFGQRWGIQPTPGMSYDDIVAEAKRRGAKPEDHNE